MSKIKPAPYFYEPTISSMVDRTYIPDKIVPTDCGINYCYTSPTLTSFNYNLPTLRERLEFIYKETKNEALKEILIELYTEELNDVIKESKES